MWLLKTSAMTYGLPRSIIIRHGLPLCSKCLGILTYSTIREINVEHVHRKSDKVIRSQEVQGWVQQSLQEQQPLQSPQTSQKSQVVTSNVRPISQEEWEQDWETKFRIGELQTVTEVLHLKKSNATVFSSSQILVLLSTLETMERYYDIDRLYQVYQKDWDKIDLICNDKHILLKFSQIMLKTQSYLKRFDKSEFFFKKYIKQPMLESYFINLGLKALLENKNYITARQFFQYMLNNQEVFPITEGTLHILLNHISHNDDLLTLKTVFEEWLLKTKEPVSHHIIALIHKQFLKFDRENCNNYLQLLLTHPRLKDTGYVDSPRYEILESIYRLKFHNLPFADINDLILRLKDNNKERLFLYTQLFMHFVEKNDFPSIEKILSDIKSDSELVLRQQHHALILKYFVKNGLLRDFINYTKDLQRVNPKALVFDHYLFTQIWECSFQSYPMLRSVLENEFRILLDNRWYKRSFPWLANSITTQIHQKTADMTGDDTFSRRTNQRMDLKLVKRIENVLKHGRYRRAKSILVDQTRLGIRPNFQLYYNLMKFSVNNGHFAMCNILDETLRKTYRQIPFKVEILNLRMKLYRLADQIRKNTDDVSFIRKESLKLIQTFVQRHDDKMNFQNYLQLSMIASRYKGNLLCDKLLAKSISCRDPTNRRETYMIYRSLLLFFVRMNEPKKYLSTLKKMHSEPNLIISKYLLNSIKSHIKQFAKINLIKVDDMVQEFQNLRKKYAYSKIEGLETINELTSFLKKWLDHEVYNKQLSIYQKQLKLEEQHKKH